MSDNGWLSGLSERLSTDLSGRSVHFIGIGGVGQNALCRVLLEGGIEVSGSDLRATDSTRDLESLGARITIGHKAESVEGAGLIVYSSAVPIDNPEIVRAAELGLPMMKRAELLGVLTRMRKAINVAGTHGKTTTSAMIAVALIEAGLDPTVLVGGTVPELGTGGRYGAGEYIVSEADEFDGSFLRFSSEIAIVTSVEPDHLDFYGNIEAIERAFAGFLANVSASGRIIACADDERLTRVFLSVDPSGERTITYGLVSGDWRAKIIGPNSLGGNDFVATQSGQDRGQFSLAVPGRHNVLDALATIIAVDLAGGSLEATARALARFGGVKRRYEQKGCVGGVTVIDDYGHHPTEVSETLRAARERHGGTLWCVFQPHTISRTKTLFNQFVGAFAQADHAIITDIYVPAGREDPRGEITSADLVRAMREGGHTGARHVPTFAEVTDLLLDEARSGDWIITMGAGDVYRVGEEFLRRSREGESGRKEERA